MNMPDGAAKDECYKHKGNHHGSNKHGRDPGCDPNMPYDQGGCPNDFKGKPSPSGKDEDPLTGLSATPQ